MLELGLLLIVAGGTGTLVTAVIAFVLRATPTGPQRGWLIATSVCALVSIAGGILVLVS